MVVLRVQPRSGLVLEVHRAKLSGVLGERLQSSPSTPRRHFHSVVTGSVGPA